MNRCDKVRPQLNALLDRELGLWKWISVRLHLLRCAECRNQVFAYRKLAKVSPLVRCIPTAIPPRRVLRWSTVVGAALVLTWFLWPRAGSPQALVYGPDFPSGKAMPISAVYAEGDLLVVRDYFTGHVQASARGMDRLAAFHAISLAQGLGGTEPQPFNIPLEPPPGGPTEDVIMFRTDVPPPGMGQPTIFFFSNPQAERLSKAPLPAGGPHFFVKVLDPRLLR